MGIPSGIRVLDLASRARGCNAGMPVCPASITAGCWTGAINAALRLTLLPIADPQMEANGVFAEIGGTSWRTVMSPIEVEGEGKERPRLAPQVGQHSSEILRMLGFNDEEILRLVDGGSVRTAVPRVDH